MVFAAKALADSKNAPPSNIEESFSIFIHFSFFFSRSRDARKRHTSSRRQSIFIPFSSMCCREERFYDRRKKRKFVLAHLLHPRCKMRHRYTAKNFGSENQIAVMRCVTVNYPLGSAKRKSTEGPWGLTSKEARRRIPLKRELTH